MAGKRGHPGHQWRPVDSGISASNRRSLSPPPRAEPRDSHARSSASHRGTRRPSPRRLSPSPEPQREERPHRESRPRARSPSADTHHTTDKRFGRHHHRRRSASSSRSTSARWQEARRRGSRDRNDQFYQASSASTRHSPKQQQQQQPRDSSSLNYRGRRSPASSSQRHRHRSKTPTSPRDHHRKSSAYHHNPTATPDKSSRKRHRSPSPAGSHISSRQLPREPQSSHRSYKQVRAARPELVTDDLFHESRRGRPRSSSRDAARSSSRSMTRADAEMRPSHPYSSRGGPPPPPRGPRDDFDSRRSSPSYYSYPTHAQPHGSSRDPSPYWEHPPRSQPGSPPPSFSRSRPSYGPGSYGPSGNAGYFSTPPGPSPQFSHGGAPPPYSSASAPSYPPRETYRGGYDRPYERSSNYSDRRGSGPGQAPYHFAERPAARGRGTFSNLSWTPATGSRGGKVDLKGKEGSRTDEGPSREPSPARSNKAEVVDAAADKAPMPSAPPPSNKIKFEFKSKAPAAPARDFTAPPREPFSRPLAQPRFEPRDDYPPPVAPWDRDRERERERDRDYHDDYRDGYRDRRDYHHDYREREDRRYYDRRYNERYDSRYDERGPRFYDRPPRDDRGFPRERDDRHREPRLEKKLIKRVKPRPTLLKEHAESESVYFRKPGNESVVGSGTYGKVFKAIHVYTGNKVALKKIRMEGERDGFPITAIREVKLLQSLNHGNVVSLHEVMVERNDCYMVFEYLSHDLTGLLNHPSFKLEHHHKKDLAMQLFTGLDYLHRRGVLHRDIKAANILVSNTGQLKLADFGLARFFAKRRQLDYTNRVITIWYRSPELLLGETQYGPAVDIWSAACVLCEIFTKHAIFPGDGGEINQLDRIYAILGTPTRSEWPSIVDTPWFELLRPAERKSSTFEHKYAPLVSPAAFDLLQQMFAFDPTKRPDAATVLKHAYFTEEEPAPRQAVELEQLDGDWHEFESKALRKERERSEKEARRAQKESHARDVDAQQGDRKRSVQDVNANEASDATYGAQVAKDDGGRDVKRQRMEEAGSVPDSGVDVPPPPPPAKGDDVAEREGSAPMSMGGS